MCVPIPYINKIFIIVIHTGKHHVDNAKRKAAFFSDHFASLGFRINSAQFVQTSLDYYSTYRNEVLKYDIIYSI